MSGLSAKEPNDIPALRRARPRRRLRRRWHVRRGRINLRSLAAALAFLRSYRLALAMAGAFA
eukprot:2225886-Lingulodinium_polyedra.AAC.1